MQKQYNIQLDLMAKGRNNTAINYIVGDSDTMPLYIQLMENGTPVPIPEGATIEMNFLNFSGNNFPRMGKITDNSNGEVLYEINSADIAINGSMTGSVTVINGTQRLTWQNFTFYVDRSLAGGVSPPDADVPWFGQVMQEMSRLEQMILELKGNTSITSAIVGKALVGLAIVGKVA